MSRLSRFRRVRQGRSRDIGPWGPLQRMLSYPTAQELVIGIYEWFKAEYSNSPVAIYRFL